MAPINVGALVFDYQAVDVIGPFDLLNSAGKALLTSLTQYTTVSPETIAKAPEFVFHHIGESLEPVALTAGVTLVPTTTVNDAPELDILLIGGDSPIRSNIPESYKEFIRRHVASGKLLFTNCTGAAVVAQTGVLDGKAATVNKIEFNWIKQRYPAVKWTKAKNWIVDGNIWTGSGAVAGMDMVAHWIKENYGLDVLTEATRSLDFEPRNVDGLFTVLPPRFDADEKRVASHVFP
ncbi:DJ-1/PfpI family protein [Aspergillus foveolatus]|uniref:DJ-1/PfpI family protein n=1 Tax=Aspergillus foveolatus TaxID=210207 RepID=UPI003CCDB91A